MKAQVGWRRKTSVSVAPQKQHGAASLSGLRFQPQGEAGAIGGIGCCDDRHDDVGLTAGKHGVYVLARGGRGGSRVATVRSEVSHQPGFAGGKGAGSDKGRPAVACQMMRKRQQSRRRSVELRDGRRRDQFFQIERFHLTLP